jgi:Fe-S oxidoreductase
LHFIALQPHLAVFLTPLKSVSCRYEVWQMFFAAGETPEVLFWVGCAGSFDQRAQKITKAFATILN